MLQSKLKKKLNEIKMKLQNETFKLEAGQCASAERINKENKILLGIFGKVLKGKKPDEPDERDKRRDHTTE